MIYLRNSLLLLLLSSLIAFQPKPASDEARAILTTSERYFGSLSDFTCQFSQVITFAGQGGSSPTITGQLRYRRGMYAIITPQQAIYCNLETQWFVDQLSGQVDAVPYDPSENVAQEILFPIYRNKAKGEFLGVETVQGHPCHKVQVTIDQPEVSYYKALVWVDQVQPLVRKMTLIDRKQTTTTYVFYDIQIEQGFSQEDFTFVE